MLPAISVVLVNFIPFSSLIFGNWDLSDVLVFFWLENIAIGFFYILRIIFSTASASKVVSVENKEIYYNSEQRKKNRLINLISKFFAVPFFIFHYGMFTAFHGMFVIGLFAFSNNHSFGTLSNVSLPVLVDYLINQSFLFGFISLFVSHGISFLLNYIGKKEYKKKHALELMVEPYGRVMIMHTTILVGGLLSIMIGNPIGVVLTLVILKSVFDLSAHLRTHRGYGLFGRPALTIILVATSVIGSGLFFYNSTLATVGGPSYIDRISYNASKKEVFYLVEDGGGRGCMPVVYKLDLTDGKSESVISCDFIEKNFYDQKYRFDQGKYSQAVENVFAGSEYLSAIDLKANDISIAVEYIKEHKYDEYNKSSEFRAYIYQGGNKKGELDFIGCYKDQPNVFRGYNIPNSDKLVLVISRIGNCFEGGYVEEVMYVVNGIDFRSIDGYYHGYGGPEIYRGDLVAYSENDVALEDKPVDISSSSETSWNKFNPTIVVSITAVVFLLIGFALGRKLQKSKGA